MKKINLYFDFLSPYSYFAWINHRKALEGLEVEFAYKPALMGKLFSHFDFKGPGEIPAKRSYELKSCFRYASTNGIAFNPPKTHPFNPMAIIRMATLSACEGLDTQTKVIDFLFRAIWERGLVLEDPELIEKLLGESDIALSVFEKSFEREAKVELKSNIKDAISHEIFGVPTFQIDDELFWGNDSLSYLKSYITGTETWDKPLYKSLLGLSK